MKLVAFNDRVNLAATSVMVVSMFGFLGNVMIDYNWGTNLVTSSIAVAYWMTLGRLIPFPLNYWGLGAALYFVVFLISFAVLNRKEKFTLNLMETARMASVILVLFEVGVFHFVPNFMDKWVIQALHGTPLESFTNWDLLALALATAVVSHLVLVRIKLRSEPAGATPRTLAFER